MARALVCAQVGNVLLPGLELMVQHLSVLRSELAQQLLFHLVHLLLGDVANVI